MGVYLCFATGTVFSSVFLVVSGAGMSSFLVSRRWDGLPSVQGVLVQRSVGTELFIMR